MKTRLWTIAALAAAFSIGGSARADLLALFQGEKANDPAPNVLLDSSGNGNHAVVTGTDGLTSSGKNGGGLQATTGGTTFLNTPGTMNAFDSITSGQSATIAFWLAGGSTAGTRNPDTDAVEGVASTSAFWMVSPDNNNGSRAFQSHLPWNGNGAVFVDIGGCCSPTQRVNADIPREFWAANEGEEWTHWAFTLDGQFGDVATYIDGIYEPSLERLGPTDLIGVITRFAIGSNDGGGSRIDARFDDFLIADEALSESDIGTLISDGPGALFDVVDPDFYSPVQTVDMGLSNVGGKLGGYVNGIDGANVTSWGVTQMFERTINVGTEDEKTLTTMLDLGPFGFSGDSDIGSSEAPVQIGDLALTAGGDDAVYKFQLSAITDVDDPVLGAGAALISTFELLVDGTGGGGGCDSPLADQGDINCDNAVDLLDFNILKANFGASAEAVPEPSTLALLAGAGCLALVATRRRR